MAAMPTMSFVAFALIMLNDTTTDTNPRANKALVTTAGAALSAMLSVTLTRHPVSERHPAPAVGTA
jgi:hypothetical protein